MCICYTGKHCPCYRNAREFRQEQTRQAIASRIEHDVLDLLRVDRKDDPNIDDAVLVASPLAIRFADRIRALLDASNDTDMCISDVLVIGAGIYFWIKGDGAQHFAAFGDADAIRLAA